MIRRSPISQNFTIAPNKIFDDLRQEGKINALAVGILLYVLSKPPSWSITKQRLYKVFTDGRIRVDTAFELLEEKNYVRGRALKGNVGGKFDGYEWVFYDQPFEEDPTLFDGLLENRQSGNRQTVDRQTVNGQSENGQTLVSTGNVISTGSYLNTEIIKEIVGYLNEKAETGYKPTSKKTIELLRARANEGFVLEDFKTVIDNKVADWKNTDRSIYLRPETLFGTKFEGYLNQKRPAKKANYSSAKHYED